MKKNWFCLALVLVLVTCLYAQEPEAEKSLEIPESFFQGLPVEEISRYYFARSLDFWGDAEYFLSLQAIDKAFEKPLYPNDIPKFWFFLAKLNIEMGKTQTGVENLRNVLLIQPDRTEILILLNNIDFLSTVQPPKNPPLGLEYFNEIQGFKEFVEFFYNPISVQTYRDRVFILDQANRFVFISGFESNQMIQLDSPRPTRIAVDPTAGLLYVSESASGTVAAYGLQTLEKVKEWKGFRRPFVQGVDRMGNVFVLDPAQNVLSVLNSSGKPIRHLSLSEGLVPHIVNDIDVNDSWVVLQDLSMRVFRFIRSGSFEEEKTIPFPVGVLPVVSCFDGMGFLLTLWDDGRLSYLNSMESEEVPFHFLDIPGIDLSGVSDMSYSPPLLTFSDFDDHLVKSYFLIRSNPDTVAIIDSIDLDNEEVGIVFRNSQVSGNMYQVLSPFLSVIDSGGYVPFSLVDSWEKVMIHEVDDGKEFFSNTFPSLKKNQLNIVVWKYDGTDFSFADFSMALLAKNVRLFVVSNLTVPPKVARLARLSGGLVLSSDMLPNLLQYYRSIEQIWIPKVTFRINLPFEGIKTVTVSTQISGMDYSDSIYYVNYMIPSVRESLIESEMGNEP
ncbi:MAG TPA: hypothetical protein P5560_01680 [Thermotogota bacterium]|nr:hypothetical protein [Thermotogota bacterium]HRW91638.1 hypothetical protein [Thermotogota bacterium]